MEPREWSEDELNASIAKLIPRRPVSTYVPPGVQTALDRILTVRTNGTESYLVRDDNGTLVLVSGTPVTRDVGGFTGRAGTITRNRKGRTSRKANGTRRYHNQDATVVMYSAASVVK